VQGLTDVVKRTIGGNFGNSRPVLHRTAPEKDEMEPAATSA